MAIEYIAGFDYHGGADADFDWWDTYFSPRWEAAGGKFGGGTVTPWFEAPGRGFFRKTILSTPRASGFVSFYYRNDSASSSDVEFFEVWDNIGAGNRQFWLQCPSGGPITLEDDDGVRGTGSSFTADVWYHMEVEWTLSNSSAGSVTVWRDGVIEIQLSGINLGQDAQWDGIGHRGSSALNRGGGIDDFVSQTTTSHLTSHRVWENLPNSDVTSEFTPSAGTDNYALVDDTNNDQDSTYVESSAADDRDVYGFTASTVSGSILAVQVMAQCKRNGGTGNIRLGLTNGTESLSSAITVDGSVYKDARAIFTTPPGGGSWTQAALDAVDVIVEATAANVRVTQVVVQTLTTLVGPDTPTLFFDNATTTAVTMHTSAFVGGSSSTHSASQWEIALSSDPTFTSPIYDPGDDATNLTSITVTGLDPSTSYLARTRHKDGNGSYSGWSNTISFNTTGGATGLYYFPVRVGDEVTLAAEFVKENASDTTTATVRMPLYDANKVKISGGGDPDRLTWSDSEDGSRKQTKFTINPIFINVTEGFRTPAWIGGQIDATGETGHESGFNYCCAWLNAPDFGLQHTHTVSGQNITLAWTSQIPCRVKYIVSTSGVSTLQEVYENGTFTGASETTSDSDVIYSSLPFGGRVYVTIVPFDEDGKRNGVLRSETVFGDELVGQTQDPAGATPTVNWALGPLHTLVLDQNCAPTFSNPILGQTYTLIIQQDSTGGWTFTWPSTVKVSGGSLPTVTSTASAEDTYSLYVAATSPAVYYLTTVCQDCQ